MAKKQFLGQPLVTSANLKRKVKQLGREITSFYRGKPLIVLGVMNGSLFFLVDLVRQLPPETKVECWRASSYIGKSSSGKVSLETGSSDFTRHHVLIVDDIFDTGRTLSKIRRKALSLGALSVEICVLLEKQRKHDARLKPRWTGFVIPDEFVIGYGLDLDGKFRNLPEIHSLPD